MENSMTTTVSTSGATTTTVKITATNKSLTFHESGKLPIKMKIVKGDGCIVEYDLPTNVTNVYKSYFSFNGEIKIDMSCPDYVISGDLYDFLMEFCYKNKNVKIVEATCEKESGEDYIGTDTCFVYCGN